MLPRRWCARSSPPNEVECGTLHLRFAAHRAVSASSRIPQVRMTGDKLTSSNRSGKKQVVRHNSAEVSAPELALLCSSTLSAWVELKGQRRRAAQRLSTSAIQCGTSSPSMMFSNASRGCTRDSGLLGSVVPSSTARTMGRIQIHPAMVECRQETAHRVITCVLPRLLLLGCRLGAFTEVEHSRALGFLQERGFRSRALISDPTLQIWPAE